MTQTERSGEQEIPSRGEHQNQDQRQEEQRGYSQRLNDVRLAYGSRNRSTEEIERLEQRLRDADLKS
jgi:hypothetical protein